MHLKLFAHGTKRLHKEPVMLMVTPAEKKLQLAFKGVADRPDYDILEQFATNGLSKAIVIEGLEEGEVMIEARAFIFAARKRFEPGTRPLIFINTDYTIDQLKRKSFSGLESEMLQYGNCILLVKKSSALNQQRLFKKFFLSTFQNVFKKAFCNLHALYQYSISLPASSI